MTAETEDDWGELPLFAPMGATIPDDTTTTDTAAIGALSHMIYDEDTPEEASELLREQGNRSFKLGKRGYKRAIASYGEAITAAQGGPAALPAYLNRANAQARIGNHGYALADAKSVLELEPGNVKALYRCATSANALRRYEECVKFCEKAIEIGETEPFEGLRKGAEKVLKRETVKQMRRDEGDERVRGMLKERGVRIGAPLFEAQRRYDRINVVWEDGRWLWPMVVVYVGDVVERSDYLAEVDEDATMGDVLQTVLAEPPEWDRNGFYRDIESVEVRYRKGWTVVEGGESEVSEPGDWVPIPLERSLRELLREEEYVTPLFPVVYAVPVGWRD